MAERSVPRRWPAGILGMICTDGAAGHLLLSRWSQTCQAPYPRQQEHRIKQSAPEHDTHAPTWPPRPSSIVVGAAAAAAPGADAPA